MARTRYYRKRGGYSLYVDHLWAGLVHLWHQPGAPTTAAEMAARLVRDNLVAAGVDVTGPRPAWFCIGAQMPASRWLRSPLMTWHLRPKGRTLRVQVRPVRTPVSQEAVDAWMLVYATAAAEMGGRIKGREAEAAAMSGCGASRAQARHSLKLLSSDMRRGRGEYDRRRGV
jgi:hypothetical protein